MQLISKGNRLRLSSSNFPCSQGQEGFELSKPHPFFYCEIFPMEGTRGEALRFLIFLYDGIPG